MVEMLGLAAMAELPVVVVDAQRGGPSTGLPTKCENGDLALAAYGAHGDAPRIVLAPANMEDCLHDTIAAFNLAERYQTPVLVLSDQSMAMRAQAVPAPDLSRVERAERLLLAPGEQPADYRRYPVTENGVAPIALPGRGHHAYHTITGLSHDEHGNPSTNNGPLAAAMMDKRQRKIDAARHEPGWSRLHGPAQGTLGIISWGSCEGAVNEAVDRLLAEGHAVRQLHLRMVYPLPVEEIAAFAATVDKLAVCELNHSGQLNRMVRAETELRTVLVRKYDGVPFTPADVVAALRPELPPLPPKPRAKARAAEPAVVEV
jgi:2-oxoglutarate ferredoxin oxidoreductase subunit alpha